MEKSKLRFYLENIHEFKLGKRKAYLEILTRREIGIIIRARTRMTNVKCNYRGKYKNNTICRFCKRVEEEQKHILEDCTGINRNEYQQITIREIFEEDIDTLKQAAKKLEKIEKLLMETCP